ncbi:MAG: metal-dependent hydrolase [Candidatus Doudnabacteria bacterium]
MTIPTHLALGLIIGKMTNNYGLALAFSVGPDIDHLISYAKHGVLFNPKKFLKATTDTEDPWGDQRSFLHNILVWLGISIVAITINQRIGFIISIAYFGHLVLDALDNSLFFPFYPKKFCIKGPIVYNSINEYIFLFILLLIYISI